MDCADHASIPGVLFGRVHFELSDPTLARHFSNYFLILPTHLHAWAADGERRSEHARRDSCQSTGHCHHAVPQKRLGSLHAEVASERDRAACRFSCWGLVAGEDGTVPADQARLAATAALREVGVAANAFVRWVAAGLDSSDAAAGALAVVTSA